MKNTKKIICLIAICTFFAITANAQKVNLFNGKNLKGWHADVPLKDQNQNAPDPFIVKNGMLVSLGDPRGHLITDSVYKDYRLEVEYRFNGKPGNCGILVHVSKTRALYDMFPKSLEVQMQHQDAGDFWCIEEDITVPNMEIRRGPKENWGVNGNKARRIKNLTDDSEKPLGEWNTMVIECFNNSVKVWLNHILVNEGTNCTADSGQIAIQAEGAEVSFKRIEIKSIKSLSKS